MSTDEVHGSSTLKSEETFNPTNPYAATKAACELLVGSYSKSFKLPSLIIRSNNIFGPRQHTEKLIPRFISQLQNGEKCPVQGCGGQMRTFVYVEDVCDAIDLVAHKGEINEIYEIGSHDEYTVLDIAKILVKKILNRDDYKELLTFVEDRDFNDFRYEVNAEKLIELGWKQKHSFEEGMNKTIDWYIRK